MKEKTGARNFILTTVGSIVYGLGFAAFTSPAELAPGGVSGLAVIVHHFIPYLGEGLIIFLLNLPLLLIGAKVFGLRYFAGTIYASVLSSAVISLWEIYFPFRLTGELFVSAAAGGLLTGVGVGLVLLSGATTGGGDIIVTLLKKRYRHIKTADIFLITDSVIVLASGIVFGSTAKTVYSAVSLYVCSRGIGFVLGRGSDEVLQ